MCATASSRCTAACSIYAMHDLGIRANTPLEHLALWRSQRYFAERIFQDAKSEGGWDELVAGKYRAWMHHAALDALALWFSAETKLDWATALLAPKCKRVTRRRRATRNRACGLTSIRCPVSRGRFSSEAMLDGATKP